MAATEKLRSFKIDDKMYGSHPDLLQNQPPFFTPYFKLNQSLKLDMGFILKILDVLKKILFGKL